MWQFLLLVIISCLNLSLQFGERTRSKCVEYSQYVYQLEDSPLMTRRVAKNNVSTCGMVEVPLVIGGIKAKSREFPHMAVIGYGKSRNDPGIKWMCGGTLISETFILTAAHCLNDKMANAVIVRLGEVDFLTTSESQIQERGVARKIQHPQYAGGKYHDLALIKMDSAVRFTSDVRPACLHTSRNMPTILIATGFGKTSYDAAEGSKWLMKVNLNIIKKEECEKYFVNEIRDGLMKDGITDRITCAGYLIGGKDTCQGDSGGPLQMALAKPYCMYSVAGVVSFGKFCGFANSPAIYTTVSEYIDWIESIVWS